MAEIVLKNVYKYYNEEVLAVDNLSLTIKDQEFVTLVGPSGCGKTTTLNMVAGLIELSEGEIRIGNRVVNDLDPKDRDIAMVFQNYALYPHKTVRQNLEFPLRMRKVDKSIREQRIARAAGILGITELLDRRPKELSGGQQQRVALGRAIVRDPAAFLMDEPLSNLDAKLRVHMRAELKHLQLELGATVIYVTHDQLEAMTMSDRVAIMNGGKLQQYGSPTEVYQRPANTFVAGFIGSPSMNLLPVTVVQENGHYRLQNEDFHFIPQSPRLQGVLNASPSKSLVLGVRHTSIPMLPAATTTEGIPAQVYTVEPTGDVTFVHLQIGKQLITASTDDPHFHPQPGENLRLKFDESRVHLFDGETSLALTSN